MDKNYQLVGVRWTESHLNRMMTIRVRRMWTCNFCNG